MYLDAFKEGVFALLTMHDQTDIHFSDAATAGLCGQACNYTHVCTGQQVIRDQAAHSQVACEPNDMPSLGHSYNMCLAVGLLRCYGELP